MVFGGRSSPLNPVGGLLRLTMESCISRNPIEPKDSDSVRLHVEKMECTGDPPAARWRHTAAVVSHSGETQPQICGPALQEPAAVITPLALAYRCRAPPIFLAAGKDFLFVFGGKSKSGAVLSDARFLCPNQQHWSEVCFCFTQDIYTHTHAHLDFFKQNSHLNCNI